MAQSFSIRDAVAYQLGKYRYMHIYSNIFYKPYAFMLLLQQNEGCCLVVTLFNCW